MTKRQRGAVTKEKAKAVIVFFPDEMIPVIDRAVRREDTDRSKFIRRAVRHYLTEAGR